VALLNLIANGVSVRQALFSSSMMMLGLMAKDYDLKGGTRSVRPMAEDDIGREKIKAEPANRHPENANDTR